MILWDERYAVGDDEIDSQHRELFKFVNDFLEADTKDKLLPCAMALYQYTRKHFKYEEGLMRKLAVPTEMYSVHVEGHERLITRLNNLSNQIAIGTLDHKELEDFVTSWALSHIPVEDVKLSKFIKEKKQ